jgi:nitroimidazol reductase NimA-like FMN-containing flavoprotein (pyridoxamine 5'-phosphate oxidase superfamily)
MRKSEREIKDRKEIEDILKRAEIIHIGMVDGGRPYVVPMNFGFSAGAIFVHGALEGRKIDVLKRNPHVCFETYVDYQRAPGPTACKSGSKFRSVIGCGTASMITDRAEKIRALDIIMSKVAPGPYTYAEDALARTNVIKIAITEMTGKKLGY